MQSVHDRGSRLGTALVLALAATVLLPGTATAQLDEKLEALENALEDVYDGQPATLEECIRAAEVGSVVLGGYEEDVLTAETDKLAALMQWLPDLGVSASYQESERTELDQAITRPELIPFPFVDPQGNPLIVTIGGDTLSTVTQVRTNRVEDVTIDQTFQSQSISSNWTVFNGFDRLAERSQASANYDASVATLDYQRDVLREDVTNAFYDYIRAQQRVQVAIDARELALQELERAETYFELGISTRSDVLQAKVRHQQTKLDVVRERNGERNAFLGLAHSMNIPGARPFDVRSDLPAVAEIDVAPVDTLLATARQQRLDLAAAEYQLEASRAGVTRARSGYWPSVQVFAQYSRSESETPFRFGAQENTQLSYGIQGQWQIFDRWRTQQRTRNAVAQRRRAEYQVRQQQLNVELEVVNLWNNLTEAIETHEVSSVAVEQSKEDLRLANERFKVGAGTQLDVITAQVNLAQARRDLVDAQINAIKFQRQLARATGASAMAENRE